MINELAVSVIYLKHIDKDGRSHVEEHVTWDRDKFLDESIKRAQDEGGKIEVLSKTEYHEIKWADRRA